MNCADCKKDCMSSPKDISLDTCMQENCPNCTNMNGNVCENQNRFNRGFRDAVKFYRKKEALRGTELAIVLVIYLLLLFWAVMLANKVSGEDKKVHLTLAIVFPPIYILSYYLGKTY